MSLTYQNALKYENGDTYEGGSVTPPAGGDTLLCLQGVLNQLANTYGLGEDDAANANWPGTAYGANTTYKTLVGALNEKNGSYGLGLNLVCNELAGTSGLYATQALNTLAGNIDA